MSVRKHAKSMGTNGEMIDMQAALKKTVAAMAVVVLVGCGSAQADDTQDQMASEDFARVINVEVSTIGTETFVEEIRLTSVAMASQDVSIQAEETGAVRELYVDRGDRVRAGQPIAKLDDALLRAQVDQARAAAELAEQTWQRRQRLWEEDEVGSELAYLEARFGAEQSAAVLRGLEERLERTVIRAPFEGIFEERHVDVGTMVSPGTTIGRVVDLDPIKVFAGVPERYAPDVRVGAGAQVVFEAVGGRAYQAVIRYVGATVNPRSRTFPIEVEIPNGAQDIKPEMVGNMAVTRRQVEEAIVVPQDALVRVEEGYAVFVVADGNGAPTAERRLVELGPTRRNLVVVDAGVQPGEQLVVVGQKSVADGDRVNVVGERARGE